MFNELKLCFYIKDESVSVEEFNEYCNELFYSKLNETTEVIEVDLEEARKLKKDFPILKDRKELPYLVKKV